MKNVLKALVVLFAVTMFGTSVEAKDFKSESDVGIDKEWTVTFNKEVNPETVIGGIEVRELKGNGKESIFFETRGNEVRVKNTNNYKYNTEYEITVSEEVESKEGQALTEGYSLKFKTVEKDKESYYKEYTYNDIDIPGLTLKHTENYDDLVIEKRVGDVLVKKLITSSNEDVYGVRVGDSQSEVNRLMEERMSGDEGQKTDSKLSLFGRPTEREESYLIGDDIITFYYDSINIRELKSIVIRKRDYLSYGRTVDAGVTDEEVAADIEKVIWDLMNRERAKEGLNILQYGGKVIGIAREHTNDMIVGDFFSHTSPTGVSFSDRVGTTGMEGHYAGENISYGYTNVIDAHEGLMYSVGHRSNILSPVYSNVGVAYGFNENRKPYMTQVFYGKW